MEFMTLNRKIHPNAALEHIERVNLYTYITVKLSSDTEFLLKNKQAPQMSDKRGHFCTLQMNFLDN